MTISLSLASKCFAIALVSASESCTPTNARLPLMATLSGVRGPSVIPPGSFLSRDLTVFSGESPGLKSASSGMPVPCSDGAPAFLACDEESAIAPTLPITLTASGIARIIFPYCATVLRNAADNIFAVDGGKRCAFSFADSTERGVASVSNIAWASATPPCPSSAAWWMRLANATCPLCKPSMTVNCHNGRSRSSMPSCSSATSASSCACVPGLGNILWRMW